MITEIEFYLAEFRKGWYHTTVKFNTPGIKIYSGEYLMTDNIAMAKRYDKPPKIGTPVKVKTTYEIIERTSEM